MSSTVHAGVIRLRYLLGRARRIDVGSLMRRARAVAAHHDQRTVAVLVDMLREAAFHQVGFQDYVDYDFAMLTAAERRTMMTHPLSNRLSYLFDHADYRHIFHDKWEFVRVFSDLLGREWMLLDDDNADALRSFADRHQTLITKQRLGRSGHAIHRYHGADVSDWDAFHHRLMENGELLVEENIVQHDALSAVCPGTVNSTRITAFFDGHRTHILSIAQKFGRGQAADQMDWGGFYTMLDADTGRALGDGYDSHGNVHRFHPDTGYRIADFQLPLYDEVIALIDRAARRVPQVQYVGWDVAVTPTGPVIIEGNWGTGVYEVKPSVLGIRTGHRPRFQKAMGF
ncbi:sugar-transfer associated ATP-grasp domain-containing protein [Microbacterium sp. PF5]|uniref:sugar-transfer associated ATP-grasp domain-containing protein n=1 Tax=Microbacterium sp. PF5 TaxID=2305435 RepID=UPI001F0D6D93|nr:sugar-transfer associated ATP-grasp domain-containing protein [Microbacterium sp. PF5]